MIVEIAPFSEALVTLRALQFPSRMRLQMKFQASPIRKASFTLIALERLLSGVKPHVILKGFDEWENPSAQVAFEGFFSGVIFAMHLKVDHFTESLSTLVT